jgi:hypothetical protein
MFWSIATANLHVFHNNLEYFPKTALLFAEQFFVPEKLPILKMGRIR